MAACIQIVSLSTAASSSAVVWGSGMKSVSCCTAAWKSAQRALFQSRMVLVRSLGGGGFISVQETIRGR